MLHMPRQTFASLVPYEEASISSLTSVERQVVHLSLGDDRRSAIEETRIRRVLRTLFRQRGPNRLADPKLEALRAFCVLYRSDRSIIHDQQTVTGATEHSLTLTIMTAAAELVDTNVEQLGKVVRTVRFRKSGKSVEARNDATLLGTAERAEVLIDSGCRAGNCGACIVKLNSGDVTMLVKDALGHDDRKSGYILACQARPKGDVELEA